MAIEASSLQHGRSASPPAGAPRRRHRFARISSAIVLPIALWAGCSDKMLNSGAQNPQAMGGAVAAGSGGAPTQPAQAGSSTGAAASGNGATASSAGKGGSAGTAGGLGQAGTAGRAGTSASAGASGASAATAGSGGVAASAGAAATAGTSGSAAGAAGAAMPAACEKGTVKASEVVFIGESFIAQTGAIPRLTTQLARTAGTIGASESYRSAAVSGTQLTTNEIPMQFTSAKAAGPIKVVLMDGGGNDLLFGTDRCMGTFDAKCKEVVDVVDKLFKQMKTDGVKDVVYFFYPDPMGIGANIKAAMDILRPEMKKECEGSADIRCVWVDQRESWDGNYGTFTSDGIHPTEAGAMASAKQIWDAMVANCIAQ